MQDSISRAAARTSTEAIFAPQGNTLALSRLSMATIAVEQGTRSVSEKKNSLQY